MTRTLHGRIYQMTVTLKGIRPPIWRRVQAPGTLSLAAFHDVIQTVFGWTDTHLHQFVIAGRTYGQPDDFDEAVEDESGVSLAEALGARTKRFLYVYDFGDNWEHEVAVEKIVAGNSGNERPLCLAMGTVIGLTGSIALSRVISRFIEGWNPRDPVAYVSVAAVLVFTGLLACWFPARRAIAIDPMAALRRD